MQRTKLKLLLPAIAAGAILTGCAEKDPATQASEDARDVAMAERMSRVPVQPVVPEPLTADLITRYGLDRARCSFRKSKTGEPLFLASTQEGFLSLSGELARMAARTGSGELLGGARAAYTGLSNWVDFMALPETGDKPGPDRWPVRMIIHDSQDRIVFTADGVMSCAE
ncbi:hypothetical protein [Novosphingobium album (ex Hu et al. 2023)]|uniref:Lipoprotein n=1 Tax=Novosphingobium album (ex Hu et al. 2023) TaxID=2930093 RepID=A0ABT0AXA6_9SPHN|nr:hypothetical protein [Novosphingobium album (ex Hu et al. 2023)]MCJ2177439.1 hypothetical protein [Novosphingobium album (ex Hu et al. 2023)]